MGWSSSKWKSKIRDADGNLEDDSSGKTKFNNTVIIFEGKRFDSKLELYAWKCFKHFIPGFSGERGVDWQVPITLMDGFKNRFDEKIVRVTIRIDFIIKFGDETWYVDTKGFLTEAAAIKLKLLEKKLCQNQEKYRVILLKTEEEIMAMAANHKNGVPVDSRKRKSTLGGWSSSKTKKSKGKEFRITKAPSETSTEDT